MILFCDANGTIQKNFGTPVYQGAANSNIIYLIAPYAPASVVTVAFQLPDGTAVPPEPMSQQNAIPEVVNSAGTIYSGWSYIIPGSVTAKYGTVTAQFYFYAPAGAQDENYTSIIATSSTTFQIGRGVVSVLPDVPDEDVYGQILTNISQLQNDLNNGYYASRAIYAWNESMTYGGNEITYYPVGGYGALVKSIQANNINQVPYNDGVLNSTWWAEVLNFNTIIAEAGNSAQAAASSAQAAASSANSAQQSQIASSTNSTLAQQAYQNAALAAINAENSAQQAATSAQKAASIVAGIGSVYTPQGSIPFASLPAQPTEEQQGYVWNITDSFTTDERFVEGAGISVGAGANVVVILNEGNYKYDLLGSMVDLSNYAQIDGNYSEMTVGTATNATQLGSIMASNYAQIDGIYPLMTVGTATDANRLNGVAASNYAQINGTYSGMTVGTATNAQQLNGVAASNYAQINGNYPNMTVGTATNVNIASRIPSVFYIDAANMSSIDISSAIAQAEYWGSNNGGRAQVIFTTAPAGNVISSVEFGSNIDYYIEFSGQTGTVNLTNLENIGFYASSLSSVTSNFFTISGCSNIEFYNVSILNSMGANLISNSTQIYFENCIIKGGTYPNPNTCSCRISDTTTANNYIIFENCIFQYGSTSSPTTVIDGSGITNANCRVTFINCLNPSNALISTADITKGSGQWYALTPTSL